MTTDHTPPADEAVRDQLLHALDFAYCQGIGYRTPEELLAAYDASHTPPADRAALRDRIAEALRPWVLDSGHGAEERAAADAVLAVLPPPVSRADAYRDAADAVAAHPGPIPYRPQLDEDGGFWWDTRDRDAVVDLLRRMADEAQPGTEAHVAHWRPVPLATPCIHCAHPFNWHDRTGCQFGNEENRCGCGAFAPGTPPAPVDPRSILGVDEDPS